GQYGVCIFPDGSECDEWAFFNGACAPGGEAVGDVSADVVVTGWLGHVVSTPAGAQYDDYLVLANDAGTVGLSGATPEIEVAIVALRDKEEPGKDAHFWGTLACDVPDYGGCQLRVTQVRVGATMTAAEPVAGWEGAVIANPPGAQFDDVFVLAGDYPMGFGLSARDLEDQIAALRDTGTIIKVWGVLRTGVPDAYGAQIEVTRFEIRD
ncbi:MAG: DUF333 domain-containing protein, partial [Anaerolineae bacterium]|nr:DUF333 domain-containing protein [Anaerolineae bacterium]